LTGAVTPAEAKRAREELIDLALDLCEPALKDYDASELFRWLRKEGKREAIELLEEIDKARGRHGKAGEPEAIARVLLGRCKRWGINPDKDLTDQLAPVLAKRVRDKGGRPVSEKTAREWLAGDGFAAVVATAGKTVETWPGGTAALQKKVSRLSLKAFGIDPWDPAAFTHPATFSCTMTVPGVVIDSSGVEPPPPPPETGGMVGVGGQSRLNVIRMDPPAPPPTSGEMTVCWNFNPREAHVGGYTMSVRSLRGDAALQKKLLKGEPLASKDAALTYRTLVGESAPMLNALRECRKQETVQPLYDYRDGLGAAQKVEIGRVERTLKVLGLPRR
jgi:hypothetical protein